MDCDWTRRKKTLVNEKEWENRRGDGKKGEREVTAGDGEKGAGRGLREGRNYGVRTERAWNVSRDICQRDG